MAVQVLRFNAAATKGYEADVGARTTFDLWNIYVIQKYT